MEFKFDKGTDGEGAPQSQDKGRQTIMLVVLLILLGGFGYLYFFTGLIRPQEKPAVQQPAPQVVKKPLPARDGAPAADPAAQPVKPAEAPKAQAPAPATPPAAPAPQAAVKPVPAPPAPQPAVKTAPAAQPAAAKPEAKKPLPAVAKPEPVKPAPPKALPVKPDEKKPAVAKVEEKKPVPAKAPVEKAVVKVKNSGPWTLVVGSYVVEETLAADMARVKNAGLSPAITAGTKRATSMHRLLYGSYPDRAAADQAVEQVRSKSGSAFSVQKGGKHEVFVGSYSMLERAQTEQQRLAAAGVKVTIQKAQVGVPTRKLTAGTFTDRAVAEIALKKLKKAAIGTPVLE